MEENKAGHSVLLSFFDPFIIIFQMIAIAWNAQISEVFDWIISAVDQ